MLELERLSRGEPAELVGGRGRLVERERLVERNERGYQRTAATGWLCASQASSALLFCVSS